MALKFTYREDHSVLVYDTLPLKLLTVAFKEYCGAITNVKDDLWICAFLSLEKSE